MALLLNVPYEEKEEVKLLGAFWNNELKKWYVKDRKNYQKFEKWFAPSKQYTIVCDYLYLIEAEKICWRCKKSTKVITFGIGNHYPNHLYRIDPISNQDKNIVHMASSIFPIPPSLFEYIKRTYPNYKPHYSGILKKEYLSNGCEHCNALQGDNFLYEDEGGPFNINSIEKAKNLNIYQIPLTYDLVLDQVNFIMNDLSDLMLREEEIVINNYSKMNFLDLKI